MKNLKNEKKKKEKNIFYKKVFFFHIKINKLKK